MKAPPSQTSAAFWTKLTADDVRLGADIDHAVLARIGVFLRGSAPALYANEDLPEDVELSGAIVQARMSLEPVRRGRSPGTYSLATQQLALGLAVIWREWTQRNPTRSVQSFSTYYEGGPFHGFVTEIVGVAPAQLRKPRKGKIPSTDHLVRSALQAFKDADARDTEQSRRGLIDEEAWLGRS